MATEQLSEQQFKARTRRSFITAGLAAVAGIFGFRWILSGSDGEAPTFLRKTFRFDEKLGRALYEPSRENSLQSPPPNGTEARLNGDIGLSRYVDLDKWKLVYRSPSLPEEKILKMTDLKQLPQTSTNAEFRCIEGWSQPLSYSGVRFSDFLQAIDPGGTAAPYIGLETEDGEYYVGLDTPSMLHPQTLLAHTINGVPLSDDQGSPLRLVIPVKYGIKSLKRVGRIFLAQEPPRDYWAERGYDWYSGL